MNTDKIKKINFYSILAIFLIIILYSFHNAHKSYLKEGMPIPHFEIRNLHNNTFTEKDFLGKVVLINFWASWCPPCIEEFPSLIKLNEYFQNKDFVLLLINVGEDPDSIKKFLNENHFSINVYIDFNERISKDFGTFKYPESYIIDKMGILRKKVIGAINWQEQSVVDFINSLIQEKTL